MRFEITHFEKIIPDAYHGTSYDAAKKICDEGFEISRGESQYLGDGVYFFESSMGHAKDWAKNRLGNRYIGVFRAVVNLGKCLDLFNWDHRNFVKKCRDRLKNRDFEITDAVVINFVAHRSGADAVRGAYVQPEKGTMFDESRFYDYCQLMICVRNLSSILSYQLVFQGTY